MAYWRSALALAAVLMTAVAAACAAGTADVLPPTGSVANWQLKEAPRAYTPDNLYEYIDGNADLFLSYGFADAAVGDYAPAKGDAFVRRRLRPPKRNFVAREGGSGTSSPAKAEGWVSVEVYNMGTPLQAFGIFGAERPDGVGAGSGLALIAAKGPHPVPVPVRAAAQSYESDGLTAFWKGPFYVKVSLIEGDDANAARQLAARAAERIAAEPAMPEEIARLPLASRIPDSERYLKTGALGHKFLLEVVSASYKVGEAVATLHIADLATPEKAVEGMMRLREFEASTGGSIADLTGVGKDAFVRRSGTSSPAKADGFAVRDSYYGEMAVARTGRFLVIGLSGKATRQATEELVKAGVASVSVGAHGPSATLRVNDAPPADAATG
jgi:hypothetical protein